MRKWGDGVNEIFKEEEKKKEIGLKWEEGLRESGCFLGRRQSPRSPGQQVSCGDIANTLQKNTKKFANLTLQITKPSSLSSFSFLI